MSALNELYHELIIDHSRNPRHFGGCQGTYRKAEGFNPLCGDQLTIYLKLDTKTHHSVVSIQFEGKGCAISMASASLMAETLEGKTLSELQEISQLFHQQLTSDIVCHHPQKLGKLLVLSGVREFPSRIKCATLAWHTLQAALKQSEIITTTE